MRTPLISFLMSVFLSSAAHSYEVIVTEQQIQDTLNSRMPLTRQGRLATLTIDNTAIDLLDENNRVRLAADVQLVLTIGIQSRGNLIAEGDVRFDDASDSFFIDNPTVIDLNIEGVPASYKPSVIQLAQQTLATSIEGQPVYTLSEEGQQGIARMMLKSMTINDHSVLLDFSPF